MREQIAPALRALAGPGGLDHRHEHGVDPGDRVLEARPRAPSPEPAAQRRNEDEPHVHRVAKLEEPRAQALDLGTFAGAEHRAQDDLEGDGAAEAVGGDPLAGAQPRDLAQRRLAHDRGGLVPAADQRGVEEPPHASVGLALQHGDRRRPVEEPRCLVDRGGLRGGKREGLLHVRRAGRDAHPAAQGRGHGERIAVAPSQALVALPRRLEEGQEMRHQPARPRRARSGRKCPGGVLDPVTRCSRHQRGPSQRAPWWARSSYGSDMRGE